MNSARASGGFFASLVSSSGDRNSASLQGLQTPVGSSASASAGFGSQIPGGSAEAFVPRDVTHHASSGSLTGALIISSESSSAATYATAMERIKDDGAGAKKSDGNANVGSLLRLFNSQFFDLWLAITYLFKFQNPGVTDYIANRLFEYPEEEIEFYIPQLCNLMVTRSTTDALSHFMMKRCAKSIHFAIKVYLYLHANTNDFKESGHLRIAEKLVAKAESVAINSEFVLAPSLSAWSVSYDKELSTENLLNRAGSSSELVVDKLSLNSPISHSRSFNDSLDHYEFGTVESDISFSPPTSWMEANDQPGMSRNRSSTTLNRCARLSLPFAPLLQGSPNSSQFLQTNSDASPDVELFSSSLTGAYDGLPSSEDTEPQDSDASRVVITKPIVTGSPTTLLPSPLVKRLELEKEHDSLEILQTKGARSEYFTRVETFLSQLNALSESLRAEPIEKRNEILRMKLRLMNARLPAALYIPLFTGNDLHHAVLRIPAEEAFVLKSKERVPFMLFIEVLESNNKSSNPDLFLPPLSSRVLRSHSNDPTVKYVGPFGELHENREARLRRLSPYGHLRTWKTFCCIVKSGDDIRQDQFALQLIEQFQRIFRNANLPLWLYTYRTLVTSSSSGFIEVVPNAISIDSLKKKIPNFVSLANYFQTAYSGVDKRQKLTLYQAQQNFVESMAAYSLVSYFLQIKDRHNGNILLTYSGHVVHIDFGFLLSNSPGSMNFESAPFKLTQEFIDVMGGRDSDMFARFRQLFVKGFLEARRHMDKIVLIVDMMMSMSHLPCFKAGKLTMDSLIKRFYPSMTEEDCVKHAQSLIDDSCDAWSTRQYDNFQYLTNGIL